MKKRILIVTLVLVALLVGVSAVAARGGRQGTTVYFNTLQGSTGEMVYCEGYFMKTGDGTVIEWRDNPECIPYAPMIANPSLHLIFKPADKFDEPQCGNKKNLYWSGLWTMNPDTYQDIPGADDEADLSDFLGEPGVDFWQVCIYNWGNPH